MSLGQAKPMIFVNVADRAGGQGFYRDTLALNLVHSDEFGDMYDLGGAFLRVTPMPDHQSGPHPVLGFDVPDIVAGVHDLKARGIAFSIFDGMGQDADGIWSAPDGSAKVAWFNDPFGNVLSLSQIG